MDKEWNEEINEIYRAIGRDQKENVYSQRLQARRKRIRRLFWWWFAACIGISGALVYPAFKAATIRGQTHATPLFSGPPEFITLALLIALAVYLRAIRGEAFKSLDGFRSTTPWPDPIRKAHLLFMRIRIAHLDSIVESLSTAGPFVVWLFVLMALRIGADTLFRLVGKEASWGQAFFVADLIIALWLVVTFIGLVISHRVARDRDDDIRAIARYCDENQQTGSIESEQGTTSTEEGGDRTVQKTRTDGNNRMEGGSTLLLATLAFAVILRDIFKPRK